MKKPLFREKQRLFLKLVANQGFKRFDTGFLVSD